MYFINSFIKILSTCTYVCIYVCMCTHMSLLHRHIIYTICFNFHRAHEYWELPEPPDMVTFAKKMQIGGFYYKKEFLVKQVEYIFFCLQISKPFFFHAYDHFYLAICKYKYIFFSVILVILK